MERRSAEPVRAAEATSGRASAQEILPLGPRGPGREADPAARHRVLPAPWVGGTVPGARAPRGADRFLPPRGQRPDTCPRRGGHPTHLPAPGRAPTACSAAPIPHAGSPPGLSPPPGTAAHRPASPLWDLLTSAPRPSAQSPSRVPPPPGTPRALGPWESGSMRVGAAGRTSARVAVRRARATSTATRGGEGGIAPAPAPRAARPLGAQLEAARFQIPQNPAVNGPEAALPYPAYLRG